MLNTDSMLNSTLLSEGFQRRVIWRRTDDQRPTISHLGCPAHCIRVQWSQRDVNEAEANVSNIHLVFSSNRFLRELRRLMKKEKVTLGGTLFHSHSGHHHAKVLMTLTSIKGK